MGNQRLHIPEVIAGFLPTEMAMIPFASFVIIQDHAPSMAAIPRGSHVGAWRPRRCFNPRPRAREVLYRIGLNGRSTIMEMSINGVREHTLPDPRLAHNDHVTIHDSSITANQSKEQSIKFVHRGRVDADINH